MLRRRINQKIWFQKADRDRNHLLTQSEVTSESDTDQILDEEKPKVRDNRGTRILKDSMVTLKDSDISCKTETDKKKGLTKETDVPVGISIVGEPTEEAPTAKETKEEEMGEDEMYENYFREESLPDTNKTGLKKTEETERPGSNIRQRYGFICGCYKQKLLQRL